MEKSFLRASIIIYIVSISMLMTYPFYSYTDVPEEVLQYAQWWFSQPNTDFETIIARLGLIAGALSLIGCIALFFLKQWGGYLFILSVLYIVSTETLLPGHAPRSSLESNINIISAISVGCIFSLFILSNKLSLFEHNK